MNDNLTPTMTDAVNAVIGGCSRPWFSMSTNEAEQLANACTKAGIRGPLRDKVQTILCFCTAKDHYSGRETRISIE